MKKLSVLLVEILLLAVFCMAACSTVPEQENTLILGGIGPLTGDYATYGVSVKQGAQIAVDRINASGGGNGITFALKFEDDEADPAKAVNAYNRLIDAGMTVSLGAVTSGACIAVAGETQKDGIFMITPSGSQKECVQYDNCFRVCFTDPQQGKASADYIAKNLNVGKIAVIYDQSNDYSVGITESFREQANAHGLEIVTEQAFTEQTNTDFHVQLQKAKSAGADLIFLPVYAQEAASVLIQAQKAGIGIPFFGCDGLDGLFEKLGAGNADAAEGVMFLTPFSADADDVQTKSFVAAYRSAYGTTPDQFAADGYDAVYTVKEAMEKAGIRDVSIGIRALGEQLTEAMTQIQVSGLTGAMTWTEDGEPSKQARAVTIKKGKYVFVK